MLLEFFISVVVVILLIVYKGHIIVHEGEKVVVENLGKYSRILGPGFHLLTPFIEDVKTVSWHRLIEKKMTNSNQPQIVSDEFRDYRIKHKNITFDLVPVECYTKEKVEVEVNTVLLFDIIDIKNAVYNIPDLYNGIETKMETVIVGLVQSLTVDEITTEELSVAMNKELNNQQWQQDWGIKITQIMVQNFTLPSNLSKSTIDSVTEKRRLESERLALDAEKHRNINKLDTEALLAKKRNEMEIMESQHKISQLKLQNEYENEKSKRFIEIESDNLKKQADSRAYEERVRLQALKESGFSEQYFIELERLKGLSQLSKDGRVIVLPLESMVSGIGSHLVSKHVNPDTISVNVNNT